MSLRDAALNVRENAYAPYSGFKVGAAIIGADGQVYGGVNVENVAYPEGPVPRRAQSRPWSPQDTQPNRSLCVADSPDPVAPCGGCRQKLAEFGAANVKVTLATLDGTEHETTIGDLLPGAFGTHHMSL